MDELKIKETQGSEKKLFELEVDGYTAFMEHILTKDRIYLTHTEVPAALSGKGVGSRLVQLVLDYIEQNDLKLVPLCPFVAAYLKRNPEKQYLLAEGYRV